MSKVPDYFPWKVVHKNDLGFLNRLDKYTNQVNCPAMFVVFSKWDCIIHPMRNLRCLSNIVTRCYSRDGFVLCFLNLVLLGTLVLFPREAAAQPRIAPGPFIIELQVAGKPVAGALVQLGGRFSATASQGKVVFDGVPAGQYKLRVEHKDHELIDREIDLPAGKREALVVNLVAASVVEVKGIVVLSDTGQPVPGAHLTLVPNVVKASSQGVFNLATNWQGRFLALDVPTGIYQARVQKPGCRERTCTVTIPPANDELVLSLERTTQSTSLSLTLVDSVSGNPLSGADVLLAEAAPLGEIARATSKADGTVSFADLSIGRLNWPDESGVLRVSRDRVTARIEAEGYEPTAILVSLHEGATRVISVNPTTGQVEVEPNNSLAEAKRLRTGAAVELKISERGDQDFFVLRLDEPTMLRIELGPKNPIETQVSLLDYSGKPVALVSAYAGRNAVIVRGVLAGTYYIKVNEWGNNGASESALTLTVTADVAVDPLEPNDSVAGARLLRPGAHARGTILPAGKILKFPQIPYIWKMVGHMNILCQIT